MAKILSKSLLSGSTGVWMREDVQLSEKQIKGMERKRAREAELNRIIPLKFTSDYRELCQGEKPPLERGWTPKEAPVDVDPLVAGKFTINSEYRACIADPTLHRRTPRTMARNNTMPELQPRKPKKFNRRTRARRRLRTWTKRRSKRLR